MLQLKEYQEKALTSLRLYLRECRETGNASTSFYSITETIWERGISYNRIESPSELAGIPYVCLRLPTGGGKTLVACHAVSVANEELLQADHSIVLWLVPSNAIREQTLSALRDPQHPYTQALQSTLGSIVVKDVEEAQSLPKGDVLGATVIIVSTLQAFRVEAKDGRKVYETAGSLLDHFEKLPHKVEKRLHRDDNGIIPQSLENLLRIHRPLVIVDEAHNARTSLSFDTLGRFHPSAIIEFTATPDNKKNPSNVLHSVSAAELKAEDMIKLPIRLETKPDWEALLADAIAQRDQLEKLACEHHQKGGDYIRPIMLLQAEAHSKAHETLTVERVEQHLIEKCKIPSEHIARATGKDRGLEDVDLFSEKCDIRYVITMQALREGWDCSFAYVLCSVAEMHSKTAVEQILGRILRLPYCTPFQQAELNRAYAFVTSRHFEDAAKALVDALVDNGFQRQEAAELIQARTPEQETLGMYSRGRPPQPMVFVLPEVPAKKSIPKELRDKIEFDKKKRTATIRYPVAADEAKTIEEAFVMQDSKNAWKAAVTKYNKDTEEIFACPSEKGMRLRVPQLCIQRDKQLELFEEQQLLDEGWDLNSHDARLTDAELAQLQVEGGDFGEVDVTQEGAIEKRFISELREQLQLLQTTDNWSDAELIYWLDKELPFIELTPEEKGLFLTAMVGDLLDTRELDLGFLVRRRYDLRKTVEKKIKAYRSASRTQAYQDLLFGDEPADMVVSADRVFEFSPEKYPAPDYCSEPFRKHFYPKTGSIDNKEELKCAHHLDQMDDVEYWVRNLSGHPNHSFWLQTSTDKFYPDFVCKLEDGRILVVEYKGHDRWSNDDSKEKRRLGELWAKRSSGSCLFIMPDGKKFEEIGALVAR